jgi:hypothetical protein
MQKIINLLHKNIEYSELSVLLFRFLFGFYLAYYYLTSTPYVSEVYSNQGVFPNYLINLKSIFFFPNIFYLFDSPSFVFYASVGGFIAAILFSASLLPRSTSLFLWYLQTSFLGRNVLTAEPSLCYTGMLLLFLAFLPKTSSLFSFLQKPSLIFKNNIKVPFFLFYVPVFIFSISFFMSAINKIGSQSWLDGNALRLILLLLIAEDSFIVNYLINSGLVTYLSFITLIAQFVTLPLFLIGEYRSSMYISFLEFLFAFIVLSINQVTLGMLLFFLFFILRDATHSRLNLFSTKLIRVIKRIKVLYLTYYARLYTAGSNS